jgi:hypothetical protein
MSDRYEGKHFLRLVDCYVLDAIGHLDPDQDAQLIEMTPKFREIFGEQGDWREIVVARMQFPEGMAGAIRQVWDSGHARFVAANGRAPDPEEFTRFFVDTNFPH